MKVLVSGGAGFIGSHVVDALTQQQHDVLVLDNLSSGRRSQLPQGIAVERADINSTQAAQAILAFAPDAVVHLAAQLDVVTSIKDPMYDANINVIGTLNLLQAAHAAGSKVFVAASSGGAVYGDPDALPASEATPAAPQSPYGVSKYAGEAYLTYFQRKGPMRCVALRLANVYGPRQGNGGEAGVVSIFTQKMLRGLSPVIYGDGRQTRDFVYVGDVARAVSCAINSSFSGPVNIASNTETNLLQLTEHLRALTGFAGAPEHQGARSGEVRRSRLTADLAREALGWRAEMPLFEGLRHTVEDLMATTKQAFVAHEDETTEIKCLKRVA